MVGTKYVLHSIQNYVMALFPAKEKIVMALLVYRKHILLRADQWSVFISCRYKIYAEGYAWSVSLKYTISCGSLALIITPQYEDFFSRGLTPKKNYWPVSTNELCRSIKFAVDWGNANPSEVLFHLFSPP